MAGVLHAIMEEVEPGLFRAENPGEMNGSDEPSGGLLPNSHIGTMCGSGLSRLLFVWV
jgi:hypothetical protein